MQLFFCNEPNKDLNCDRKLDDRYRCELWRPSITSIKPRGLSMLPFAVWWLFHYSRLFVNRDYCIFLVYDGEAIIHRSCVFPGYFRFPFMAKGDLQIGDAWTDEEYRGKGIAPFVTQEIVRLLKGSERRFWFVIDENNAPSIRAYKKTGFSLAGKGKRTKRFGLRIFGAFVMK